MTWRKNLLFSLIVVWGLGLLLLPSQAEEAKAEAGYFGAMNDLPVMAGLVEDDTEGVVFDTPEGRIVEVSAHGVGDIAKAEAFYRAVLPQLGWEASADGSYVRAAERLEMVINVRQGNEIYVHFSLSPKKSAK